MVDLIVDTAAFDHPAVLAAAIRREAPTRYALVEEGGEYAAVGYFLGSPLGSGIHVLTEPARRHLFLPLLDPDLNLARWSLEEQGVDKTKALELSKKWSSKKYDPELLRAGGLLELITARPLYEDGSWQPEWVDVAGTMPRVEVRAGRDYKLLNEEDVRRILLEYDNPTGPISLDFETTGRYPLSLEPDGFSFSYRGGTAYYVPMRHTRVPNVSWDRALRLLEFIVERPWIAHNAKFEMQVLLNLGVTIKREPEDTMLLAWHLGLEKGLKKLALSELGEKMDTYGDVTSKTPFADLDPARVLSYACADADMTLRLWSLLQPSMTEKQRNLYEEVDRPLIEVLASMERRGVELDVPWLEEWEETLTLRALDLELKLRAIANINWNSGEQVSWALFTKLGLDPQRFNSKSYATDQATLDVLRGQHPVIDLLLAYRETTKQIGTYAIGLREAAWDDGRLRGQFNGVGTKTGRLASQEPNMQNIPGVARAAVRAGDGRKLVAADYSQIELRILAHASGCPVLGGDFRSGESPHVRTLKAVFGTDDKHAYPRQYILSKSINFGVVYGVGPGKLVQQAKEGGVDVTVEETKRWLASHHQTYPRVWEWREEVMQACREQGFVEDMSGHRAWYPDINDADISKRGAAERESVNKVIQGAAGYGAKRAMVTWHRVHGHTWPLLINVHDELVIEADDIDDGPEAALDLLRQYMVEAVQLSVPVDVEGAAGNTWKELK